VNVYDTQGRLLVVPVVLNLGTDVFLRKDVSDSVDAGVIYTFSDVGANFRIKNGTIQFLAGGLYYTLVPSVVNGQVVLGLSDTGEA